MSKRAREPDDDPPPQPSDLPQEPAAKRQNHGDDESRIVLPTPDIFKEIMYHVVPLSIYFFGNVGKTATWQRASGFEGYSLDLVAAAGKEKKEKGTMELRHVFCALARFSTVSKDWFYLFGWRNACANTARQFAGVDQQKADRLAMATTPLSEDDPLTYLLSERQCYSLIAHELAFPLKKHMPYESRSITGADDWRQFVFDLMQVRAGIDIGGIVRSTGKPAVRPWLVKHTKGENEKTSSIGDVWSLQEVAEKYITPQALQRLAHVARDHKQYGMTEVMRAFAWNTEILPGCKDSTWIRRITSYERCHKDAAFYPGLKPAGTLSPEKRFARVPVSDAMDLDEIRAAIHYWFVSEKLFREVGRAFSAARAKITRQKRAKEQKAEVEDLLLVPGEEEEEEEDEKREEEEEDS